MYLYLVVLLEAHTKPLAIDWPVGNSLSLDFL